MSRNEASVKRKFEEMDWTFEDAKPSDINSIHPYPAKFIEQLPEQILEILQVDKKLKILDPFAGSGTTLVAAKREGYDSIGIDLNPIAYLLTKVKTTELPDDFIDIAEYIIDEAISKVERGDVSLIEVPNASHWFSLEVHTVLSALVHEIQENLIASNVKDALEVALSSIIVRVSFQESDTRYAAKPNDVTGTDVVKNFLSAVKKVYSAVIKERSTQGSERAKAEVFLGSSLDFDYNQFMGEVGAVITSPPYPNAYEYWLYHKFRMEFLGYSSKEIKKEEIGTRSRYFKKIPETIDVFRKQMATILNEIVKVMADGGYVVIVVGRSVIHGEMFDNGSDLIAIGKAVGFDFVTKVDRDIKLTRKAFNTKTSTINNESLVVFRKNGNG